MTRTARCPAGCGRAVLYARTARGKNLPLNPTPDPRGTWVPIAGRAWQRWELAARGEPWSDWADAPAHVAHPVTCPLWNPAEPAQNHGSARGHLACMACGTIDHTVRHADNLDLCSHCRPPDDHDREGTPVTPSDRQAYALTHPITDPDNHDITPYQQVEPQPDGNLILSMLAVDR